MSAGGSKVLKTIGTQRQTLIRIQVRHENMEDN